MVDICPRCLKAGTHMRTKCAYVWMLLQTCTVPFTNSSHTIHHEPRFVGFLCEHEANCARCVDRFLHVRKLTATSMFVACALKLYFILCSPKVYRKLVYHLPSTNCLVCTCTLSLTWPKIGLHLNLIICAH